MPELTLRAGKGSELTHNELDANFKRTVSQKTANYTCLISDNRNIIEGNHATTAFTITLPTVATAAASDTGDYEVTITNINAAIVSVDGNGVETINGGTDSIALGQWESVTVALNSAQTAWVTVGGSGRLVVSNHVRAGNLYVPDGAGTLSPLFVSGVVTEDTWESVGPTGSGADNIWADMDDLPSNARVLKVVAQSALVTNSTNSANTLLYVASGDVASPTAGNGTRVSFNLADDNASGFQNTDSITLEIPLGTDQVFKVYWATADNASASAVNFYYRGFVVG